MLRELLATLMLPAGAVGVAYVPSLTGSSAEVTLGALVAQKCPGADVAIASAIAMAESTANSGAVGDKEITDETWGPSFGLWQVRSLWADESKGTARDATRLPDPNFNAQAMCEVSGRGKNWTPWTMYVNGEYRKHLGTAANQPVKGAAPAAKAKPSAPEKLEGTVSLGDVGRATLRRADTLFQQAQVSVGRLCEAHDDEGAYVVPCDTLDRTKRDIAELGRPDTEEQSSGVKATITGAPSKGAALAKRAMGWVGASFKPGVDAQCAFFVRHILGEEKVEVGVTRAPIDSAWPVGEGSANSFGPESGEVVRRIEDLQVGDIVMYANTYGSWDKGVITHVAIYVGDGMVVDRPTKDAPVKMRSVHTWSAFVGAIRPR